jgi:hypothetical protein
MKLLLIAGGLLFSFAALSQNVVDVNRANHTVSGSEFFTVAGNPFVNTKYVSVVEGTPYFSADWMKGVIVLSNNQEFKQYLLRINLDQGELLYKDELGNEMIATSIVKEVILTDDTGNNYRFIHSSFLPKTDAMKEGWYLWLCTGTASLYKFFTKTWSEIKQYGSATVEQRIRTVETYFIHYNNSFFEVKKLKEVPGVLANKKAGLEDFLSTRDDKSAGMDDRFTALVEYFNSISGEAKK